jgi:hypothetical protein
MAAPEQRPPTAEELRLEIRDARDRLADAVVTLRDELGEAADIAGKLRAKLPLAVVGALGAGFFVAGGIGATVRLVFRRGREGDEMARLGRFSVVDRD